MHRSRPRFGATMRPLLAGSFAFAALFMTAGSAAADPSTSFLRLNGYGGVAEQVLTPADVILVGGVGSFGTPFGPPQPDLFISSLNLSTFERWQITLVPPIGAPLVPGTYSDAGWVEALPLRPAMQVLHHGGLPFNYDCRGGSFTINSIDVANSFFDVEWTQECLGVPVSGRAVFVAPPDTAPPSIQVPSGGHVFATATGPDGAIVPYEVTARDGVDPNPELSCSPPSGSVFPIGDAVVNCTATDASGNSSSASFAVHVRGASEQVADLIALVDSYNLRLLGTALHDKLVKVQEFLAANKPKRACEKLDNFLAQVMEQRGKRISVEQADRLILDARRVKAVIGC